MIDLHCHILPGVDDGAVDLPMSIRMAQIAADDGIRVIVATPHINDDFVPLTNIYEMCGELNSQLKRLGIEVSIVPGGDVSALLSPAQVKEYTINGGHYILTEFPHSQLPRTSKEILFNLSVRGLCPIITHPERNRAVIENPDKFLSLIKGDVLVQITADSLTGAFGRDAQACAIYLLRKGVVNFIATDAHSSEFRRPVLTAGLKVAEKFVGKAQAKKLVFDNPAAVLQDKPLP